MPKYFKLIFICVALLANLQKPVYATDTPKTGTYITKHSNGKVAQKGYLKNGEKHRLWMFYDEKGIVIKKEKWKNGTLQWQVFYNERGRIIKTVDKNGKEKEFSGCGC